MITKVSMKNATRQQIFDHVVDHLRTQTERATIPDPQQKNKVQCVYRDGKGNACAVGCCITDEEYSPQMEGLNVDANIFNDILPSVARPLLLELQLLHDSDAEGTLNEDNDFTFEEHLSMIASRFNVTLPPKK